MSWTGAFTVAGLSLLAQWVSGTTLNITKATAGPGGTVEPTGQALSIISTETKSDGYLLGLSFSAASSGYICKDIGVYAKLGSAGTETLLVRYTDTDGIVVPSASSVPEFCFTFYAYLKLSSAGTLNVTIDPAAYVSVATLQTHLADTSAHGIGSAGHLAAATTVTNTNAAVPTSGAVYRYTAAYKPYYAGASAPSNTNLLWIDLTAETGGLKYYNGSAWVHVPVAYNG